MRRTKRGSRHKGVGEEALADRLGPFRRGRNLRHQPLDVKALIVDLKVFDFPGGEAEDIVGVDPGDLLDLLGHPIDLGEGGRGEDAPFFGDDADYHHPAAAEALLDLIVHLNVGVVLREDPFWIEFRFQERESKETEQGNQQDARHHGVSVIGHELKILSGH